MLVSFYFQHKLNFLVFLPCKLHGCSITPVSLTPPSRGVVHVSKTLQFTSCCFFSRNTLALPCSMLIFLGLSGQSLCLECGSLSPLASAGWKFPPLSGFHTNSLFSLIQFLISTRRVKTNQEEKEHLAATNRCN